MYHEDAELRALWQEITTLREKIALTSEYEYRTRLYSKLLHCYRRLRQALGERIHSRQYYGARARQLQQPFSAVDASFCD